MGKNNFWKRSLSAVKKVIPGTLKTIIWITEITVSVSFVIMLLRYFNILPWISDALSPLFRYVGLPGEAALAYVSGYFVNVYSAIAVAVTINLDWRELTILGVMVLCSHNIIVETAVQKKTGSSAIRMVIIRTLSAIILGLVLNWIIPQTGESAAAAAETVEASALSFLMQLKLWAISAVKLVVKMVLIIFALNILQALLVEFGIIKYISRFLKPLMKFFGIPPRCSFLWIIANTVGLAYGAAAMIEEAHTGNISKKDIDLLNTHICISHSNLEDLILLASIGACWWILLLSRWAMSLILVWCLRLEVLIRNKFLTLQVKKNE